MAKSISDSVGRNSKNKQPDVKTIQQLLNDIPADRGGANPKLDDDGFCGNKTIEAIQKFQLKHFGWNGADGKILPNGQTMTKLNEEADKAALASEPTAESFRIRLVAWDGMWWPGANINAPHDASWKGYEIEDAANVKTARFVYTSPQNWAVMGKTPSRTFAWSVFHTNKPVRLSDFQRTVRETISAAGKAVEKHRVEIAELGVNVSFTGEVNKNSGSFSSVTNGNWVRVPETYISGWNG